MGGFGSGWPRGGRSLGDILQRNARRRSNLLAGAATVFGIAPGRPRHDVELGRIIAPSAADAVKGDWRRTAVTSSW